MFFALNGFLKVLIKFTIFCNCIFVVFVGGGGGCGGKTPTNISPL